MYVVMPVCLQKNMYNGRPFERRNDLNNNEGNNNNEGAGMIGTIHIYDI